MRLRVRCLAIIVAAGMFAGSRGARAAPEPNEGSAAVAESLFQEGRKLMDAKRFDEACPKLVASHKLAPAVGTLLNLADCYERGGKLASAWARFHEAIALAQRLGRPDREKTAKERADKLEPRLIKLTVTSRETDVQVKLDGSVLDPTILGAPVPVDAGRHSIEASAKGKKSFSTTIDVSERARAPAIDIPALASAADAPNVVVPDDGPPPPVEVPPSAGGTQRLIGIVGVGLGGAGLVIGSIYGLRTSSKWSEAKEHCTGLECDRTGVELAVAAKNAGTISTISFVAGGVLALAGAAIFFTAPRGPRRTAVGLGLGTLVLRGTF